MKACIQGFLGKNHSWSKVQQEIARQLIKKGHEVELSSTNGLEYFPNDLKPFLKNKLFNKYDFQFSYTAPHNWGTYLPIGRSAKPMPSKANRFGCWTYEWDHIPHGMGKHYKFTDKILAPSNFSKQGFVNAGIPTDHIVVVPHGINLEDYQDKTKLQLKTNKSFKIAINIAQAHRRKNIERSIEAYFKAFSKNDDVCLVAKISTKKIEHQFEVDTVEIINRLKQKYPNHPEIELITNYIPNIIHLYNACDVVYLLSFCEGFGMPYLEGLGAGKIVIAPRYGAQLDFLNDKNSLLVEGNVVRADPRAQYWTSSPYNSWFQSDLDSAIQQLRKSYQSTNTVKQELDEGILETASRYTWGAATDMILALVQR